MYTLHWNLPTRNSHPTNPVSRNLAANNLPTAETTHTLYSSLAKCTHQRLTHQFGLLNLGGENLSLGKFQISEGKIYASRTPPTLANWEAIKETWHLNREGIYIYLQCRHWSYQGVDVVTNIILCSPHDWGTTYIYSTSKKIDPSVISA